MEPKFYSELEREEKKKRILSKYLDERSVTCDTPCSTPCDTPCSTPCG